MSHMAKGNWMRRTTVLDETWQQDMGGRKKGWRRFILGVKKRKLGSWVFSIIEQSFIVSVPFLRLCGRMMSC